jgi:integrase
VPQPPKGPPPRILTFEEEARLIPALPDHGRRFAMFLISTGCLIEEARLLRWVQVDLVGGQVWFPRMGDRRHVPLDRDVIAELRWLPSREGPVFRKPDGKPYAGKRFSCVDKSAFNAACLRAGLRGVTQKTLQYTWVARQLAKGRSVRELLKLVGCADRRMIARVKRGCQTEIEGWAIDAANQIS